MSSFARCGLLSLTLVSCGGATSLPAVPGASPAMAKVVDDAPPSGPPTHVDCGDFTTCAIASGGSVRCWGRDKAGELGDGGGTDRPKSVIVHGVENATAIALASRFGCALGVDKKVRCWGTGRLANDGKALERARAVEVIGVEGAEELVASGAIACARNATAVACWGADVATIGSPPAGVFTQIAAGFTHGCALDKRGAVTCWGTGDWSAPRGALATPPIVGATFLVAGDRHACVVTKDKKVQCWGQNDTGQLGTKPDQELHKAPVTVPGISGAIKLVAGEAATCALLGDGSARCWGSNLGGELGLGRKSSDERPTAVTALSNVGVMCLATAHGCALTRASTLVCWGANAAGQLGNGSHEARLAPTNVTW